MIERTRESGSQSSMSPLVSPALGPGNASQVRQRTVSTPKSANGGFAELQQQALDELRSGTNGRTGPPGSPKASQAPGLGISLDEPGTAVTPAYPAPSTVAEQLSAYHQSYTQRAKMFLGSASQTVTSLAGSPSNRSPRIPSPWLGASSQRMNGSSTSPNLHHQPSSSSRRQLTGKDRAHEGPYPTSKWHALFSSLATILPNLPSTGPKRVRTRARRLLILFTALAVVCYIFSNTLQEAYHSAAVKRRREVQEEKEWEAIGHNLQDYEKHPIEVLTDKARKEWEAKVARQSKTPEEGAAEYRRRYKRDPPYGFKEWFEYARDHGTLLIDEYDTLMASLEPFWALDAAELRRRTFQIGMQPSFALVHVEEESPDDEDSGGTFWDANENDELIKPFGVERARGFERMVRPFVGKPGMVNMVFAVNELAEPRVLVPWEERLIIEQTLKENKTVNLRHLKDIPGKERPFFPNPVWTGDGTTWETYIRTCPPDSAARRVFTTMKNSVIHLADTIHVAYSREKAVHNKRRVHKVHETVQEGTGVEVEVNGKRHAKLKKRGNKSPPAIEMPHADEPSGLPSANRSSTDRPGEHGWPVRDVYLPGPEFMFNDNVTSLSHDTLCNLPAMHDTQGQFCSDFRSLDTLYPVFSPSSMPGFSDILIPSHYYASTGAKYHLDAHRKRSRQTLRDELGITHNTFVYEPLPAWETRANKIFWRGSTTGGGNNPAGRQLDYQRHRFVRMTSEDSMDPQGVILPPPNGTSDLTYVELPRKVINEESMDVAFTSLDGCGHEKVCDAVKNGKYRQAAKIPLMDITKYKMLMDIDGMAYSARFMALMESGAAVLKSTIYKEYYSDQIQPWLHFIPVSNLYSEVYNIYSYFLGQAPNKVKNTADRGQHYERVTNFAGPDNAGANEELLKHIGEMGQLWQTQFGKTKDMEIYCYRLAIEWGRLWQRDGEVGTF